MKKETLAIHTCFQSPDAYGALSMPVYHTAAYEFPDAGTMADAFCGRIDAPDYSRVTNPTVTYFENKVKCLTGADEVIAFSSGMAAISNTLMCLAGSGKNIVTSRHMFGNTFLLITQTLRRFGVEARLCDLTDPEDTADKVDENTCCIYAEIISNPQMEVADLKTLAEIAHKNGVPLVADTTMIPFTEFSAAALGVDIEIVSSTKYLSGGATSIGGLVIDYGWRRECKEDSFGERMRKEMLLNCGAYMSPHVAYMQTLGLETLSVRYRRQAATALEIAGRLQGHPAVRKVSCIGLEDNPFHELAARQFGPTCGAMITIDLADKEACFSFINRLKLIRRATNLFDNKSLAIHPASTIFGNFTPEERAEMDVLDTTIRLSIGLETPEDLLQDILQALQ